MSKNFYVLCCVLLLSSCTSKKEILYLQDANQYSNQEIVYANSKIQTNDVLRINVSALIPDSAIPYNKVTSGVGNSVELMQLDGYLVSEDLTINFPILGVLSTANMTTQEFAIYLKSLLIESGHLKNPTVDVRLVNAKVTVLGEVNQPGTFSFTEQNVTLLQALGYAGDLTINGKREDITIIRYENGVQQIAHIDLTSADWLNGPFNFVKPNDTIIVDPNNPKVKSAGFVGNVGTLISVVSILFSTIVLITK
ncbi:polysaccharide biosynthesis/export family protein [Winogradskyella litoriviva]|uniref:Polysaccharide biosynthesis/export family protein n=1 Tax=Winogradskyella litoriviva TaxID=1220182 RepID=A0ABX2E614_9FLAO|nr:polysaccharide biosynthesis/export family protein [Winogradskyella litoriviva]NRD23224.1 polysaccharide biosynthesis/export family protein [Winogradskyella litoriviva]